VRWWVRKVRISEWRKILLKVPTSSRDPKNNQKTRCAQMTKGVVNDVRRVMGSVVVVVVTVLWWGWGCWGEEVIEGRKRWWAKYFPTDGSAKSAEGSTPEFAGASHGPMLIHSSLEASEKLGIVNGVGKEGRNSSPNSLNHVTDERGAKTWYLVTTTLKKVSLIAVHGKYGVQRFLTTSEIT
jgi:hypothetical protein